MTSDNPLADKSAFRGVGACVFDAYGTLFDFNAAVERCRPAIGEKAGRLSEIWRFKQLQYSWLRGLMDKYTDFWQVTGDALDFALATCGIDDATLRARLLDLYWNLDAYAEVPALLGRLKAAGIPCAILSNGSPAMLRAAAESAGIDQYLAGIYSVGEVGVFKPHPSVYDLPQKHLGLAADRIAFQSANAWDAAAASAFGFRVAWINRAGQPPERLPWQPAAELQSLADLPALLGLDQGFPPTPAAAR